MDAARFWPIMLLLIKLQQLSYVLWAFKHSTLLLIKLQQFQLRWVGGVFVLHWAKFFTKLGFKSYLISKNEIRVYDYKVRN
jgi:hypothetical protein